MDTSLVVGGLGFGIVVTILTSVLKTINLDSRQRQSIAVVLSLLGGVALTWNQFDGDYSTAHLTQTFAAVYASSQLIYQYLLSGTNLDQVLTAFSIFGGNRNNDEAALEELQGTLTDSQDESPTGA